MKDKTQKKKWTKSEKLVTAALIYFAVVLQELILLSAFGKDPMENLAVSVVTSIPITLIGYLVKSYKGKKEEENMKFKRDSLSLPDVDEEDNPLL